MSGLASDRRFQLGLAISLLLWLGAGEILCRRAASSGFWYRQFDFSGRLVSRAELDDRIRSFQVHSPRLALMGDSVIGPSALVEHRVTDADAHSLTSRLREVLATRKEFVFSLGADGLLLPDIDAVTEALVQAPPERVLLLLNARMFAPEFQRGPAQTSRPWLAAKSGSEPPADESAQLAARVEAALHRDSALFRSTQLLKTLWYFPTQRDFLQRRLEEIFGREEDDDVAGAALRMKVFAYYRDATWSRDSPAFRSLASIVERLQRAGVRTQFVLTPQNAEFLKDAIDADRWGENRRTLKAFLVDHARSGMTYVDWTDRYPADRFLDHCHLTAAGNDEYARDLAGLIAGVS